MELWQKARESERFRGKLRWSLLPAWIFPVKCCKVRVSIRLCSNTFNIVQPTSDLKENAGESVPTCLMLVYICDWAFFSIFIPSAHAGEETVDPWSSSRLWLQQPEQDAAGGDPQGAEGVREENTTRLLAVKTLYYSSFKVSTCSTANCRYVQSPRSSLIPLWGEKTTQHGLVSVYTNSQHHREKLQTWSSDKRPESRSVSKAGSDSLSWLMLKLDLCQLSQRVSPRQEKNVACKRSAFIIWRKCFSSFRFPPTLNTDSSFRRISPHTPADTQYLWKQYLQKTDILYRR